MTTWTALWMKMQAERMVNLAWLNDLYTTGRDAPLTLARTVLTDLLFGVLFFAALWWLITRWSTFTLRSIANRKLWDDERKQAEQERITLLTRYLVRGALILGGLFALGLFSLRYSVPVLQDVALVVRTWLLDGGIGSILTIILVGFVVQVLLVVVRKAARALTPTGGSRFERQVARAATIRSVIESSAQIALITLFVLFSLSQLGADVLPLLTGVGVLGLAISFGAQSLVKDLISGFFILAEDQFGVGDVVTLAGLSGLVERVNLRITTLRDIAGNVHIVPNGQIGTVTVMSRDWSRTVLDIEVAYKTDLNRAITIIGDEALRMYEAREWNWRIIDPPEVLGVETLGSSGVTIRLLIKTLPKEQWGVGREFRRRIKARFDLEDIEIPYPHLTLYLGNTEQQIALSGQEALRERGNPP